MSFVPDPKRHVRISATHWADAEYVAKRCGLRLSVAKAALRLLASEVREFPVKRQEYRYREYGAFRVLQAVGSCVYEPSFPDRDEPPPPRSSKRSVPHGLRYRVFERDGFRCKHCGAQKSLSVDHVIPFSKGGPTTLDNLQTLCRSCNSRKRDR